MLEMLYNFMRLNNLQGKLVFTPYESGMYKICVELSRPLPEEFWEYGNPMVNFMNFLIIIAFLFRS